MSPNRGGGVTKIVASEANGAGEWITPPVSYVDPARRFCELCGRPIARRFWQARTESGVGIFCDPAHAALYATYPQSPNRNDD